MRTTPRMIFILKRASSMVRWRKTLTRNLAFTWWQEQTEQNRNCHNITGVYEEVTYCSPSKTSGKQKKDRSTKQPQFRSKNTPATMEADQILLALQQLANNNNTANFHNNINGISKFPNCQCRSRQRCPRSTGNLRSSSCLKTFSKRVSKFIISWPKMTGSITSILSWEEMRYKLLKTLMAQPERTWEKF